MYGIEARGSIIILDNRKNIKIYVYDYRFYVRYCN